MLDDVVKSVKSVEEFSDSFSSVWMGLPARADGKSLENSKKESQA